MARERFVSQKQRKFVMAKLKKEGFPKPIKIRQTDKFLRARIVDPTKFQKGTLRTFDVGKKGGTIIILGRRKPKTIMTTSTQAVLIPKN